MQSSTVNKVIKDVDFCRCTHGIAECHLQLQVVVGYAPGFKNTFM